MPRDRKLAPWEDIILRLIAIYKLLHGLVFIAIGLGLFKLKGHNVPEFLMTYVIEPFHFSPENRMVAWVLDEADTLTSHKLGLLGYAAFFYAILFLIEGTGLYLRKHWAEYFVVIVTGSLLPFEIWAIIVKVQWWKAGLIFGNLLILAYLVHRLRVDFTNSPKLAGGDSADDQPPIQPEMTEKPVTFGKQ
jgi:uncharacterized membrane protein (DUF2068 family)